MAAYKIPFPVPTPQQDQRVKIVQGQLFAASYYASFSPGYTINGVPNVFQILHCSGRVTCDANVANRTLTLQINSIKRGESGVNILNVITGNITASQTGRITLTGLGSLTGVSEQGANVLGLVQMDDLYISGDDTLSFIVGNPQGNDYTICGVTAKYLNNIENITQL